MGVRVLTDVELVKKYTPWIEKCAYKFNTSKDCLLDKEDLVSIGRMAIFKAIDTYDSSRSKIDTHIMHSIRFSMGYEVASNLRFLSRSEANLMMSVNAARKEQKDMNFDQLFNNLSNRLSRKVHINEVKKVLELEKMSNVYLSSLKKSDSKESYDWAINYDQEPIEDIYHSKELIDIVNKALDTLSERNADIMRMKMNGVELKEIAKKHKISLAGVCYVMKRCQSKIKKYILMNYGEL